MESAESRTCPKCDHVFTYARDLKRHLNGPRPCIVSDPPPELLKDPLACKFCFRKFATNQNLQGHKKICKMKDRAAIVAPPPAIRAPTLEEIRAEKLGKLKKLMEEVATECNMALTLTGLNLSYNVTPMNCTVINPLSKPSLYNIVCTREMIVSFMASYTSSLYDFFLKLIYFNPAARENYSIAILDRNKEFVAYYDNGVWLDNVRDEDNDKLDKLLMNLIIHHGKALIDRLFPTLDGIESKLRSSLETFGTERGNTRWNAAFGSMFKDEHGDVMETHNSLKITFPRIEAPPVIPR